MFLLSKENVPGGALNLGPTQDQIRPSRPSFGSRNTEYERVPYDPRENTNWNTLGSRRPPQSNIGDATSEANLGKGAFKYYVIMVLTFLDPIHPPVIKHY